MRRASRSGDANFWPFSPEEEREIKSAAKPAISPPFFWLQKKGERGSPKTWIEKGEKGGRICKKKRKKERTHQILQPINFSVNACIKEISFFFSLLFLPSSPPEKTRKIHQDKSPSPPPTFWGEESMTSWSNLQLKVILLKKTHKVSAQTFTYPKKCFFSTKEKFLTFLCRMNGGAQPIIGTSVATMAVPLVVMNN